MKVLDPNKLEALVRACFTLPQESGSPRHLRRVEMEILPQDLLAWLRTQPAAHHAYWQSRDGALEIAAVGRAWQVCSADTPSLFEGQQAIRTCLDAADEGVRVLGGAAFDPAASVADAWGVLGRYAFWVPRMEMVRRNQTWSLAVNGYAEDLPELLTRCQTLGGGELVSPGLPAAQVLSVEPSEAIWHDQVTRLVAALGPSLEKLVLACRCQIELDHPTDPFTLLSALREGCQGSYDFVIQAGDTAFLGRTPECLYRREGIQVTTEALAGTGGKETTLRKSKKEILEHDYVIRDIAAALQPVCRDIRTEPARDVVSWGALQHLCTRFHATLCDGKHDGDLLQALHPSAAVLGFPRSEAWQALAAHEPFKRGWYAGPVGWISREAAEFAVGIRSALLRDRNLTLYAGAGIVQGSDPAREWQELQAKIRPFLHTLGIRS